MHLTDLTLGAGTLALHVPWLLPLGQLSQDALLLVHTSPLELLLFYLIFLGVVLGGVKGLPPTGRENMLISIVPGTENHLPRMTLLIPNVTTGSNPNNLVTKDIQEW